MDKSDIKKALDELNNQPRRKFVQSYDLIINLKNVNLKQGAIDFFATLHYSTGRKVRTCAFVDQQLFDQASRFCDKVIKDTEFPLYQQDRKLARKLARDYDYFIAQSTLMIKIASTFGKALGTRGKMPNPKLGCIIPPNGNIESLIQKLNHTIRLGTKHGLNLQASVGKENQPPEEIIDNVLTAYQVALKQLPSESQNIKNVLLKPSMGQPVRI